MTDTVAGGDSVRRLAAVVVSDEAALLALIVTINAWNTVGVAARPWPVDYSADPA